MNSTLWNTVSELAPVVGGGAIVLQLLFGTGWVVVFVGWLWGMVTAPKPANKMTVPAVEEGNMTITGEDLERFTEAVEALTAALVRQEAQAASS